MAITLTLTTAKLSSISIPSLAEAVIAYVLGYYDGDGVFHDVMVDNGPTTFPITLMPGNPILSPGGLAELVTADAQARYGMTPDTVIVHEAIYQLALLDADVPAAGNLVATGP